MKNKLKFILASAFGCLAFGFGPVVYLRATGGDVEGTASYRAVSAVQGAIAFFSKAGQQAALTPGAIHTVLESGGANANPDFTLTPSVQTNSMVFGVGISTTAAGSAGVAITAPCTNVSATSKAIGGGCSCTGGVSLTSTINRPDVSGSAPTAAQLANGWLCQDSGGTGGACAAFAICGNILQ